MKKMNLLLCMAGMFASLLLSCDKEDNNGLRVCGCNSPTVREITNAKGTLIFNSTKNQYLILTERGSINGFEYICSSSKELSSLIGDLKDNAGKLTVIYSGEEKKMCESEIPISPGFIYAHIVLTDIKKENE